MGQLVGFETINEDSLRWHNKKINLYGFESLKYFHKLCQRFLVAFLVHFFKDKRFYFTAGKSFTCFISNKSEAIIN